MLTQRLGLGSIESICVKLTPIISCDESFQGHGCRLCDTNGNRAFGCRFPFQLAKVLIIMRAMISFVVCDAPRLLAYSTNCET
jgi:hypothetical protein